LVRAQSLRPACAFRFGQHAHLRLPSANGSGGGIARNTPTPDRPYPGLEVQDITGGRAKELGLSKARGVEVTGVESDSPAVRAGFLLGDVVLDYNGQAVEGKVQFLRLVKEMPVYRQVKIGVWRAGERLTLTASITAGCAPPTVGNGMRVDPGVSAPVLIQKVEPEYSPEARKAKLEGTVMLYVQINTNGDPTNIRVIKSLGLGLDEKAVESVKRWKFKPS
jgi:TonB family protein